MMCLYVNCSLACVVMVVESKWGFPALMRSLYLVKGMGFVSMFMMLKFWSYGIGIVWMFSDYNGVLNKWICILVSRGELVITDVVEEFGCDYVDLPLDVENVPHDVSVFVA
ncbi:hypothetical protein Tco_1378975 [Tanacetum coccineum]